MQLIGGEGGAATTNFTVAGLVATRGGLRVGIVIIVVEAFDVHGLVLRGGDVSVGFGGSLGGGLMMGGFTTGAAGGVRCGAVGR